MLPTNYSKAFKAYDIRGLRESEINETFAYILGVSLGSQYPNKNILIACDARVQNDTILDHLISWLNSYHCQAMVISIQPDAPSPTDQTLRYGIASTSVAYQLTPQYDLTIVVSASHNPAWYVGFKVTQNNLAFIPTKQLLERFDISKALLTDQPNYTLNTQYQAVPQSALDNIKNNISHYFESIKPWLKIVVDYSNGAATTFEQHFLHNWAANHGHTLIELNTGADGLFTAHSSDTQEDHNYQQLITAVLWDQADLGILFDGDADRIWLVSSSGQIVPGDLVLSILIWQIWVTGKQIVFDAMCGNSIRRAITNSWNIPVVCKMGRFFINEKMREIGAFLGGEISGHIMFSEFGASECTLVAISYILKSLAQGSIDQQLIQLTDGIYREPMRNPHVERKDEILSALMEHFTQLNPLQIDGVNIYSDTMCMTARKSNTEPIIRIQLETANKAQYQQIIGEIKEIVKRIEN
jgi:phosphomannomutase